MGVLEPLDEVIDEEVPATPPDLQDLQEVDSEDDLFAETKNSKNIEVFNFKNDLSFKNIIPVLPTKGEFEDFLGSETQNLPWAVQTPQKKKNFCSRCFDEMKKDLKKLAKVIENYKNERDAATAENESLKKELEELKKILKQKEENEKSVVNVVVDNQKESVDVTIKRKNFQNAKSFFNKPVTEETVSPSKQFGVNSLSITLPKQSYAPTKNLSPDLVSEIQPKSKKTIAELRREFFAQEFKSEQKSFTAHNYLEVKPEEEKKDTVRTRLNIKVQPKQRINEIISNLTTKLGSSKVVPQAAPITMFQRFEKTKEIWRNRLVENFV